MGYNNIRVYLNVTVDVKRKKTVCAHIFICWHRVIQYDVLGRTTTWGLDQILLNGPYLTCQCNKMLLTGGGGQKNNKVTASVIAHTAESSILSYMLR